MYIVHQTNVFADWLKQLPDTRARSNIAKRIFRIQLGNLGDWKPISKGISELRIDIGPGYRIYFIRQGVHIIFLLCAGDKSSQPRDIEAAKSMANDIRNSV